MGGQVPVLDLSEQDAGKCLEALRFHIMAHSAPPELAAIQALMVEHIMARQRVLDRNSRIWKRVAKTYRRTFHKEVRLRWKYQCETYNLKLKIEGLEMQLNPDHPGNKIETPF